jgi:sugar lactone lactonase YvrE
VDSSGNGTSGGGILFAIGTPLPVTIKGTVKNDIGAVIPGNAGWDLKLYKGSVFQGVIPVDSFGKYETVVLPGTQYSLKVEGTIDKHVTTPAPQSATFSTALGQIKTVDVIVDKKWQVSTFVSTNLSDARGITTDGTYFYVADDGSSKVVKIDSAGAVSSQINVGGRCFGIVAAGADLYVVVGYRDNNKIRKIPISTGIPSDFVTGLSYAYGITSVGNFLYVAEYDGYLISKVNATGGTFGGRTVFAGGTRGYVDGLSPQFYSPQSVAADGGFLYVVEFEKNTIRKVNLSTQETVTLAGSPGNSGTQDGTGSGALFNMPVDVKPDGAGNLYVVHFNGNSVRKVQIATGKVTTLPLVDGSLNNTRALCISGGDLYVLESNNIKRLNVNW